MVDLTFASRAQHFVPLSLLRYIADNPGVPDEIKYIGEEGGRALKGKNLHLRSTNGPTPCLLTEITGMDLVRKGRLSVQRVDEKAWRAISLLTMKGGWEEMNLKPKKASAKKPVKGTTAKSTNRAGRNKKGPRKDEEEKDEEEKDDEDDDGEEELVESKTTIGRKRKTLEGRDEGISPVRRSTRARQ